MRHYYASRLLLKYYMRGYGRIVKTRDGLVLQIRENGRLGNGHEWIMNCRRAQSVAGIKREVSGDNAGAEREEYIMSMADELLAYYRVQEPLEAVASLT